MVVSVDDLVKLYNGDIIVQNRALDAAPERLLDAVKRAHWVRNDEFYGSVVYGPPDQGPFNGRDEITFDEYLSFRRELEVAEAAGVAKRKHTKARRASFTAMKSQLVLAMLDAGVRHICATDGCEVKENLTIDHILPLSRGGSDDLGNLQFLCRSHNSAKGDRLER